MNTLTSYSAIAKSQLGTRVRDRNGHTALRVRSGWRYEASTAPGLMRDYQMLEHAPLQVLEVAELPSTEPPEPSTPQTVIGRLYWDPTHPSPWVSFKTITEYRYWAREVRKAMPGTRVEKEYVDGVHRASLLRSARMRGAYND